MVDLTYQMVLSTLQTAGILVGISYYLVIMRNSQRNQQIQLETRQAQLFMQVYSQWTGGIHKHWAEISGWEWDDYDDYLQKYGDLESQNSLESVGGFFEGIGGFHVVFV